MGVRVKYKHGDKTLFTFTCVRYWMPCVHCGEMSTRKLLTSKGVLAKELFKGAQEYRKSQGKEGYYWNAVHFCSEKCIKQLIFEFSIKGSVKIRKRVEAWLNQAPQEYICNFGPKVYKRHGEAKSLLVRVLKNQDNNLSFVEFYQAGGSYNNHRPIQFMIEPSFITNAVNNISNLFNTKEVEEKNED